MPDINTIRNLRNNHEKSIEHIRKELNINWRTAKKYADQDILPQPKIKKKTGMMYEQEWGNIVSSWLEEDAKLPKKKRRTRKYMLQELVELGFPGSYRTLCDFVQSWKATHVVQADEDKGFERLEHPPAEAQLDFGTMEVVHDGAFKDVKVLLLTFPFSNAGFAYVLPAENQECLLEGMKKLFQQSGGVPKKIRIDNMSTAVLQRKSKSEEPKLTDGFLQFATHYGFETQVCNPRSGHEKGNVENKVGYIRYNFFPTSPIMKDFDDLNQQLAIQLTQDQFRLHYEKNSLIHELWNEEQQDLLMLPETDYPVFKEIQVKANKYNEISLDNTRIHISRARNHSVLFALLTHDSYQIISGTGEIIEKGLRPYMHKKRQINWQSVFRDWRRKPKVIPYSRYWKYLPERIKYYLNQPERDTRRQRIDQLLQLLVTYDMQAIDQQFYQLIEGVEKMAETYEIDWGSYDAMIGSQGVMA